MSIFSDIHFNELKIGVSLVGNLASVASSVAAVASITGGVEVVSNCVAATAACTGSFLDVLEIFLDRAGPDPILESWDAKKLYSAFKELGDD